MSEVQQMAAQFATQAGQHNITVGGNHYTIKLLPTSIAIKTGMELFEAFLPALGAFGDNQKNKDFILPEEDMIFTEIAVHLSKGLGKTDVVTLFKQLLEGAYVNNQPLEYETQFAGKLGDLRKLVTFALKENFSELFTGTLKDMGLEIPTLGEVMKAKGQTQEESKD